VRLLIGSFPASAHIVRQRLLSLLLLVHGPFLILLHSLTALPPNPQGPALERRSVRCMGPPNARTSRPTVSCAASHQATRAKSVRQSRRLRVRARDEQYLRAGDSCVSIGLGDGIYLASPQRMTASIGCTTVRCARYCCEPRAGLTCVMRYGYCQLLTRCKAGRQYHSAPTLHQCRPGDGDS
jgi:hypothetical protein